MALFSNPLKSEKKKQKRVTVQIIPDLHNLKKIYDIAAWIVPVVIIILSAVLLNL